MKSDYIIDFERINQLTSFDDPNHITQPHSISKNIIKQYMEIFLNKDPNRIDKKTLNEVIETLEYNKIIISKSTIRNNNIDKLL